MRTTAARDGATVAAMAHRLEVRLLDAFWQTATSGHTHRLALLLDYTAMIIRRPTGWDPEAIRAQHAAQRGTPSTVRLDRSRCFACSAEGQLYGHHIIEIQYGGSNAIRNQVPLCFDCHQYLHPWLTEDDRAPTDRRVTGFESIGEIAAREALKVGR